jgi:hypothetical protein
VEVPDDSSINSVAYNFVQLSVMQSLPPNSYVDFLGVLINKGGQTSI